MPTVLRLSGFRFVIHQLATEQVRGGRREHLPEHVHAIKAGNEVVIEIATIGVREVKGMSRVDIRAAVRIAEDHQKLLLGAWRDING